MLNLLIWHTGSSGAIPLGAFFSLVSLWFIISIPLCYSGATLTSEFSNYMNWEFHTCPKTPYLSISVSCRAAPQDCQSV